MLKFSDFLRTIYAPTFWYGQVSVATIENYMISAERYMNIVSDINIFDITPAISAKFTLGLRALGQSLETERKHCRHLNSIFLKIGPPGPRNRDALGWVKDTPWIRPPKSYRRLPREIPDHSLRRREHLDGADCQTYHVHHVGDF